MIYHRIIHHSYLVQENEPVDSHYTMMHCVGPFWVLPSGYWFYILSVWPRVFLLLPTSTHGFPHDGSRSIPYCSWNVDTD